MMPGLVEAHVAISGVLLALAQPDEALAAARAALTLRPKHRWPWRGWQPRCNCKAKPMRPSRRIAARWPLNPDQRGRTQQSAVRAELRSALRSGQRCSPSIAPGPSAMPSRSRPPPRRTRTTDDPRAAVARGLRLAPLSRACRQLLQRADDPGARPPASSRSFATATSRERRRLHRAISGRADQLARHRRHCRTSRSPQQVRDDRIDILVDLAGHIGGNRLLVFARKPAPVQVTYLGYQNTTGMSAMDYRLTDEHADPPGMTDALYTERLVRLPESFFCFAPARERPRSNALPAATNGLRDVRLVQSHQQAARRGAASLGADLEVDAEFATAGAGLCAGSVRNECAECNDARGARSGPRCGWSTSGRATNTCGCITKSTLPWIRFRSTGTRRSATRCGWACPRLCWKGTRMRRGLAARRWSILVCEISSRARKANTFSIATALAGDLPRLAALRSGLRERMRTSVLLDADGLHASIGGRLPTDVACLVRARRRRNR